MLLLVALVILLMVVVWLLPPPSRIGQRIKGAWSKRPKWLTKDRLSAITISHSSRYREDVIGALKSLVTERDGGVSFIQQAGHGRSLIQAVNTLQSLAASGLVTHEGPSTATGYYPTVTGLDFLERHEHSIKVWSKENWFPFTVAAVSSVIGIVHVVITSLNYFSNCS